MQRNNFFKILMVLALFAFKFFMKRFIHKGVLTDFRYELKLVLSAILQFFFFFFFFFFAHLLVTYCQNFALSHLILLALQNHLFASAFI